MWALVSEVLPCDQLMNRDEAQVSTTVALGQISNVREPFISHACAQNLEIIIPTKLYLARKKCILR